MAPPITILTIDTQRTLRKFRYHAAQQPSIHRHARVTALTMSPLVLAVLIVAAAMHAWWNLLSKRTTGAPGFVPLYAVLSALVYAIPVAVYVWYVPVSFTHTDYWLILASGLLNLLYSLVLQRGYQTADFSVVYPMARGSGPLVSSIGAMLLLGEHPTWLGLCGIALIVGGIFLIAGGPGLFARRDPSTLRGVGYGLATGMCIAGYTLVDGYAIKKAHMSPVYLEYFGMVVRAVLLLPGIVSATRIAQLRANGDFVLALKVAVLFPLAYLLALWAMQHAPVSYVAPTRELSMLIGAYLGVRMLGERSSWQRITGTVLLLSGVVSLVL